MMERWIAVVLVMLGTCGAAQSEEIDAAVLMDWVEALNGFGAQNAVFPGIRQAATPSGQFAAAWLEKVFFSLGLRQTRREPVPMIAWNPSAYGLAIETDQGTREVPCWPYFYTPFVGEEALDAELVYVGAGSEGNFAAADVRGKIVVADMLSPVVPPLEYAFLANTAFDLYDPGNSIPEEGGHRFWHFANAAAYQRAAEAGAAAFVAVNMDKARGARFFPNSNGVGARPSEGKLGPLPGLCVNREEGAVLRQAAERGARARFTLEGEAPWSESYNVVGVLPGEREDIIQISSHFDGGAVNDGTGVAAVLGLAKFFLERSAEEGPLRHTLQFVLTGGHFTGASGTERFCEEHRDDVLGRVAMNVTLEHVGKHYELIDGVLEDSGEIDVHAIASTDEALLPMLRDRVRAHDLRRSYVFSGNAASVKGSGEGWYWHEEGGVPSIWHISPVQYMQSTADTLEKVAVDELARVVKCFADIVVSLDGLLGGE